MKSDYWILNGTLCTLDRERAVKKANLRISQGKIVEISSRTPRGRGSLSVFDAKGLTLLPGFVQAHVHLCQTLFRGLADELELLDWLSKRIWLMEAAHTAETLYTSAMLGIHELLSSGTTCVLDMGTVRHTESIFKAAQKTGIRANIGKCLMDHPDRTPPYLREDMKPSLEETDILFKKWHGKENDRLRMSYAPRFVPSCSEPLLLEVSKRAKMHSLLVHTHASENQKEIALVEEISKSRNIEYFHKLGLTSNHLVLAHCVWLNEDEKKILKRQQVHVTHCPSSNLKLASGIAPIPDLLDRGINVALGADGAPCNNNLNMFQEMRLAALIHKPGNGPKSMRALEVLEMATHGGAKALGWFDQIGSIEVGKKADLIALDLNQLENGVSPRQGLNPEAIASSIVYSSQPAQLRWTMVDGKVLYRGGKVAGVDRSKLTSQVHRARGAILDRAFAS